MTENSLELVYVSAQILRQRFRDLRIHERFASGEFDLVVHRSSVAPASRRQPPGTLTQRIIYLQGQTQIAVCHRYLRPNGTLGASGLPDPKWLRDGNRILMIESS